MSWWSKQTPPTCAGKRKREDDDGEEKLNSSFQVPSYARLTNARVKAGTKLHLLTLPEDIRKYIFRIAEVEEEPTVVPQRDQFASKESGLLKISQGVRAEALQLFYAENSFDFQVREFDSAALVARYQKVDKIQKSAHEVDEGEENEVITKVEIDCEKEAQVNKGMFAKRQLTALQTQQLDYQREYAASSDTVIATRASNAGKITFTVFEDPSWANLVRWLKLFHEGEMPAPPTQNDDGSVMHAVTGVFKVVDGLVGEKWSVVEKILPGLRDVLGAAEPKWMEGDDGLEMDIKTEMEE